MPNQLCEIYSARPAVARVILSRYKVRQPLTQVSAE